MARSTNRRAVWRPASDPPPDDALALAENESLAREREQLTDLVLEAIQTEVEELCGPANIRRSSRRYRRIGTAPGKVLILEKWVKIRRPRVIDVETGREVALKAYERYRRADVGVEVVHRLVVEAGVPVRRVGDVLGSGYTVFGHGRSNVSKLVTKAGIRAYEHISTRSLRGVRARALYVDGIGIGGFTFLVALGLLDDGSQMVLGISEAQTESADNGSKLFESLRARGLDLRDGYVFVSDGGKGPLRAKRDVLDRRRSRLHPPGRRPRLYPCELGLEQRCQWHKARNITAHAAVPHRVEFENELRTMWSDRHWRRARHRSLTLAAQLETGKNLPFGIKDGSAAARSLREGLDRILMVSLLQARGVARRIRTTNPVEALNASIRRVLEDVTRWRSVEMRRAWIALALLRAEQHLQVLERPRGLHNLARAVTAEVRRRADRYEWQRNATSDGDWRPRTARGAYRACRARKFTPRRVRISRSLTAAPAVDDPRAPSS